MRTLRPSIKKTTPRRALLSASGAFRRVLTPLSVQHPTNNTEENGNAKRLLSTTPKFKSIQRLLQYTPPPHIIPVTPAERSKSTLARKLRSRRLKLTRVKRRQHRTRILISASLVFLYYVKSGGQTSISNNADGLPPVKSDLGLLAKAPSVLESPSTTYEKFLSSPPEPKGWSLKRKAHNDKVHLGETIAKRLRVEGGGLREGLAKASERLQNVPPYPTALTQTHPNFDKWQQAIVEASERLQSVPPYPTPLTTSEFKLPVAVTQSVKNLAEQLPVAAAAMKESVKNLADRVPVAAVGQTFKNLAERVPVAFVAMKENLQNLTKELPVAETRQIVKKWTELPLSACSHPLLQQKEKQEQRHGK